LLKQRRIAVEWPIKFLLSRDDYYHQRGYFVVASALRDAGIEVILGGIQIPREIVETAIQEDVDIIGYRIMQGAPKVLLPILFDKMKERGIEDIPIVVGGIVPEKDEILIRKLGVREVFPPLTPLEVMAQRVKSIGMEVITAKRSQSR
jgi:methylmalonyl-CoA mutase C-terminal domain/subunit